MKEVEKFIKENTKYQKGSFVTSKTLYFTFKSLTKSKITKKNFKEYCDEHLTVKTNFWGIGRKNKKKKIRSAYAVEFKIENKWRSEYMVEEKKCKRRQIEGYIYDIRLNDNSNVCDLVTEDGELLTFCAFKRTQSLQEMKQNYLEKVKIEFYENGKFKNIHGVKKVDNSDLTQKDVEISAKVRKSALERFGILGRALFGKVEKIEEVTREEKEMLNVG